MSVPGGRFAPGRYEVQAELRAGPQRAWERTTFRASSPSGATPVAVAAPAP